MTRLMVVLLVLFRLSIIRRQLIWVSVWKICSADHFSDRTVDSVGLLPIAAVAGLLHLGLGLAVGPVLALLEDSVALLGGGRVIGGLAL